MKEWYLEVGGRQNWMSKVSVSPISDHGRELYPASSEYVGYRRIVISRFEDICMTQAITIILVGDMLRHG